MVECVYSVLVENLLPGATVIDSLFTTYHSLGRFELANTLAYKK